MSVRDASSSIIGGFGYPLSNEVLMNFTINTPHHYLLMLSTDWKDRYYDTALKLNHLKMQVDLECDEVTHIHPTTIHAYMKFMKMVSIHCQVMTSNAKQPIL